MNSTTRPLEGLTHVIPKWYRPRAERANFPPMSLPLLWTGGPLVQSFAQPERVNERSAEDPGHLMQGWRCFWRVLKSWFLAWLLVAKVQSCKTCVSSLLEKVYIPIYFLFSTYFTSIVILESLKRPWRNMPWTRPEERPCGRKRLLNELFLSGGQPAVDPLRRINGESLGWYGLYKDSYYPLCWSKQKIDTQQLKMYSFWML